VRLFRCSIHGSPAIVRLCSYIVYFNHFNNHNHIGVTTLRGREAAVKGRHTLIEHLVTRINKAHRIIVKQVVYDEFMKQIRTVRHSFNNTGMANYQSPASNAPFN